MCARMKMLWATSSCLPVLAFIWLLSDQVFGGPAENSPVEMQSSADIPLVEISKELSEGESASIKERAQVVSAWYTRQGIEVAPENVPIIAAMGSGGGCLAMISFMAILEELKNQDLLDAFMYTYGCSGSTWALTTLYDSGNWVTNLEKVNAQFFAEIADPTLKPSLAEALSDLLIAGEREDFSMTDIWATAFVNPATKRHNNHSLSSWKAFQENGSVPYAVLAAVDKKAIERTNFTNPDIEVEFTTHQIGYITKGAYVVTTHYGSKFNNKQLVRRFREPDLSYFQALWGSAIASNQETLNLLTDFVAKIFKDPVQNGLVPLLDAVLLKKVFPPGTETPLNLAFVTNLNQALALVNSSIGTGASKQRLQDLINLMSGNESTPSSQLATLMAKYWDTSDNKSKTDAVKILSMTMAQEFTPKLVPVQSKEVTLLLKIVKCLGTWTWGTTNNFNYNITTIEPPKIYLMDSGVGMMTPFPLALRRARNTDLMLNMDFWPLDPFNTVMRAANYCSANNISFPPLVIPEGDEFNPSQACYIFEGLNKPTVIHFPIFNQQNSGGAVKELTLQYIVLRNQYSKAEIDALIGYARANVRICASKIKEKILQLVKKR